MLGEVSGVRGGWRETEWGEAIWEMESEETRGRCVASDAAPRVETHICLSKTFSPLLNGYSPESPIG